MNTAEKFTYKDEYYFIDSWDNGDGIVIKVVNSYGNHKNWHSNTGINDIFDLGPWVSAEVDAAILTYLRNGGFAGLTPVEYLRSLGLTE